MNNAHNVKKMTAGALLSGCLGLATLGWARAPPTPTAQNAGVPEAVSASAVPTDCLHVPVAVVP